MANGMADGEEWEKFLDNNYYQLSRRIRVESLLGRLRCGPNPAISQDDQEIVLNTYHTQFLKAGHLIDVIRTRGRPGFEKFMEAIEYEYPDVYQETTNKIPRRQNKPNTPGSKRGMESLVVVDKMGDLIGALMQKTQKDQKQVEEFQNLVAHLKDELQKQVEEKTILEDQTKELIEKVKRQEEENLGLKEDLAKENEAKEVAEKELLSLRRSNLEECCGESRKPVERCSSLNPYSATDDGAGGREVLTSNSQQRGNKKTLSQAFNKGSPPLETKSEDVRILEAHLSQLQEKNDRLHCRIEKHKEVTEQCQVKQEEAEAKTRAVTEDNKKLKKEAEKMENQCRVMADMIRRLKDEIDSRQSKQPKQRPPLHFPRMFPEGSASSLEEEEATDAQASTEGSNHVTTEKSSAKDRSDKGQKTRPDKVRVV